MRDKPPLPSVWDSDKISVGDWIEVPVFPDTLPPVDMSDTPVDDISVHRYRIVKITKKGIVVRKIREPAP